MADRAPYAASTRNPAPELDRAGSFSISMGDAEDPERFPMSPGDERARRERLDSPTPSPQAALTDAERAALVAGCLDAVLEWAGVYGGADLLIRGLAERLGIPVEEAERLVVGEVRRRGSGGGAP